MLAYNSAANYLQKLNGSQKNREHAAGNLHKYCVWAKLDPDGLLALKDVRGLQAEKLLDSFVCSNVDLPESTKWQVTAAVRGFYRVNYADLRREAGKMEYTVKKAQKIPSKDTRFKLYQNSYTPRDKVLVTLCCCTAIARETMSRLRFSHFEDDWQRQDTPHISVEGDLLKGHNKGRYRGVRQETFVTPECKRALLEYREWYTKTFGHVWRVEDPVFLAIRGERDFAERGLVESLARVTLRAGVKFSIHDGRRIVQTALENVGCPNNWIKKIKGRKVSGEEAPYSRPAIEQLRGKYVEALGELEFLGAGFGMANDGLTEEEKLELRRFLKGIKEGKLRVVRADE